MTACTVCDKPTAKVIYFGLPGRLCLNYGCALLTGLASLVPEWLQYLAWGEDGAVFMTYKGSYFPALWRWLTR